MWLEIDAYDLRVREAFDRDVRVAWMTSRIYYETRGRLAKKHPMKPLEAYLLPKAVPESTPRQTMGQMRTMLHLLAAQYGGAVTKGGRSV